MSITHLVTHSGGFHADELLSTVVLSQLFPKATLVRSRDAEMTSPGAGKLIYDVGRAYDAAAGIFDHHQRPNPLRPDGQPYSSFGLIWAHFGRAFLQALAVPDADIEALHLAGRDDEARKLFETMLSHTTQSGMLSEDLDFETDELWGNFPQTYSLVGVINCAGLLSKLWSDVR
mgnify:CR=1 FL=1